MEELLKEIFESDLSTNKIATLSGVDQSALHKFRKGQRDTDNMTLGTYKKLKKFWEELNMKNIRWTGKSTDGNSKWTAEGQGYKDLFETLIQKYDDAIVTYEMLGAKKLEVNGEDLEKYEVTADGICNWELFEEFEARTDLKELSEEDYKEVIEDARGNAYYQTFEEETTVAFIEEGDVKETKTGYTEDIVEWVVEILNNMATDYDLDFEDLITDVEQAADTEEVLQLLEENFNDSTYKFSEK